MDERAVVLNELAQGRRPTGDGVGWFAGLAGNEQVAVLERLTEYCLQAGASPQDVEESARRGGIQVTHTPAVLLARGGHLGTQLRKIVGLPADERVRSFRLLVGLLGVADERRRTRFCANVCNHEWHRLTD